MSDVKSDLALLPNQSEGEKAVEELIKKGSGGFLPRLKCAQGIGKDVTEGRAMVGDLMLGDRNLGRTVKVVVGPFRSNAYQMDQVTYKVTEQSFDPKADLFRALQRRQKQWQKGANAGPEYLCWAPELEEFILIHYTRGALKFAKDMQAEQGNLVTIQSQLIGGKTRWPVFDVISVEQTPYTPATDEDHAEALKQFVAPLKEKKGAPAGRAR